MLVFDDQLHAYDDVLEPYDEASVLFLSPSHLDVTNVF
jgi:hypothetical protein